MGDLGTIKVSLSATCRSESHTQSHPPSTHQRRVQDAEHVCVVEQDMRGMPRAEGDVGDGCVPLQPILVQAQLLQFPAPRRVASFLDAELEHLEAGKPAGEA